jgi:hypothetical protein
VIISPLGSDREGDSANSADGDGIAAESAISLLGKEFRFKSKLFFYGPFNGFQCSIPA